MRGRAGALDHETIVSPSSIDVALSAAGSCVELAEEILEGYVRNGFALVRPPGHHAGFDRSGGYCVFNNVAIAASHALHRGVPRVLILDIDAHRGDGTQEIFAGRSDVLVISIHQDGLFPAEPPSAKCKLHMNVPLPPGADDEALMSAIENHLTSTACDFKPGLVIVSAGFDGHADDFMSALAFSTRGFKCATQRIRSFTDHFCDGRLLLVLEGGYDGNALSESVAACISALSVG